MRLEQEPTLPKHDAYSQVLTYIDTLITPHIETFKEKPETESFRKSDRGLGGWFPGLSLTGLEVDENRVSYASEAGVTIETPHVDIEEEQIKTTDVAIIRVYSQLERSNPNSPLEFPQSPFRVNERLFFGKSVLGTFEDIAKSRVLRRKLKDMVNEHLPTAFERMLEGRNILDQLYQEEIAKQKKF